MENRNDRVALARAVQVALHGLAPGVPLDAIEVAACFLVRRLMATNDAARARQRRANGSAVAMSPGGDA